MSVMGKFNEGCCTTLHLPFRQIYFKPEKKSEIFNRNVQNRGISFGVCLSGYCGIR